MSSELEQQVREKIRLAEAALKPLPKGHRLSSLESCRRSMQRIISRCLRWVDANDVPMTPDIAKKLVDTIARTADVVKTQELEKIAERLDRLEKLSGVNDR